MLLVFKSPRNEAFTYPNLSRDLNIIFEDPISAIRIRNMSLAELVEIRQTWLVPEGWGSMKHTFAATYANDQNGFYFLEKGGQKIASISVVTYPKIKFAYIGFYVVTKPFRGQGYGKLLINKTMEYAAKKLGITAFGLNCVEDAVPMYQKYGFNLGTVDEFWKYTAVAHSNQTVNETDITSDLLAELINYDCEIFGARRKEFLTEFLFKPSTITVIAQENHKIQGYGVISEREPAVIEPYKSYRVGPLYANNSDYTQAILKQLITVAAPNESIFLETPGNNSNGSEVVKSLGFEKIGQQPKLFKGIAPNFDVNRIFCYNSIAIGG